MTELTLAEMNRAIVEGLDRFRTRLDALTETDWDSWTRCPGWRVRDLAWHVAWGEGPGEVIRAAREGLDPPDYATARMGPAPGHEEIVRSMHEKVSKVGRDLGALGPDDAEMIVRYGRGDAGRPLSDYLWGVVVEVVGSRRRPRVRSERRRACGRPNRRADRRAPRQGSGEMGVERRPPARGAARVQARRRGRRLRVPVPRRRVGRGCRRVHTHLHVHGRQHHAHAPGDGTHPGQSVRSRGPSSVGSTTAAIGRPACRSAVRLRAVVLRRVVSAPRPETAPCLDRS